MNERHGGQGGTTPPKKRTRMVRPYPTHTLEDALGVARAIQESNAGLPFDRELLATALGTTPASSGYTMRLNSAAKYGLTRGAYNDARITLTPRGEAVVAPSGPEELQRALLEAALHPDVFGRLFKLLDGKRLPEDAYARNMLQRELGISPELSAECLGIAKANGLYVGVLHEAGDALYVSLTGLPTRPRQTDEVPAATEQGPVADMPGPIDQGDGPPEGGRVFIGHGGPGPAVQLAKEMLDQFGVPYGVVDTDVEGDLPVPSEVAEEMRRCTAAVLVLSGAPDEEGTGERLHRMLYQIGAASVLYGDRVVVLGEDHPGLEKQLTSLERVDFDSENPAEAGLALLRALLHKGVVKVTV